MPDIQYTREQLFLIIEEQLPNNNNEAITAGVLRGVLKKLGASVGFFQNGEVGGGIFPPDAPIANVTVGGITIGYPLANKQYGQVITDLLNKFLQPGVTLAYGGNTGVVNTERGPSLNTFTFNYSAYSGSDTLLGLTLRWNGQDIYTVPNGGGGVPPSSGSITIDLRTLNLPSPDPARKINSLSSGTARTFELVGDFNDSGNKYSQLVFAFPAPFFYGNGMAASQFNTLSKAALEADNSRSGLVFTNNNDKMIIAYDAAFPNLTKVIDAVSGYNILGAFNAPVLLNHTFADGNVTSCKVYVYAATIAPSTNTLSTQ